MRNKPLIFRTFSNLIITVIWLVLLASGTPLGVETGYVGGVIHQGSDSHFLHHDRPLYLSIHNYTGCGGVDVPAVNEAFEQQVVDLVNEIRAADGLPPLQSSDELVSAARYHATDMALDGYFSHDTYDPGNPDPVCSWAERISTFYTGWNDLGENIATGQATPQQVVDAFMNSADHAANILHPNFNEIGVGYFIDEGFAPHWVQNFGGREAVLGNLPDELRFVYSIALEETFPVEYLLIPENINNSSPLSWTLSTNDSWISVLPASGATPDSFSVSLNGFTIKTGEYYTGSLSITVVDPEHTAGSPHTITVILTFIDDPLHSFFLPIITR